jgi:hypothetical protein
MSSNFIHLAIATALGLNPEGLVGFRLDCNAGEMPKVQATYLVRDGERLRRVLQLYEVRPTGTIGFSLPEDK